MEAAKTKCPGYTQRRPELTPCYKIIQNHLSTFIANRESEGRPLPDYVLQEFDAYLKCGIHAYGFLRLKCQECKDELIVAFSCKKRGFCPSCAGKRMTETAAHLVDNVLPFIPYRQFVVSFPIPLRYWLNANKKLYSKLHSIIIKEINQYYISKASCKDAKPGTISFTQRFGSALNLNPHLHILCADGVYIKLKDKVVFRKAEPISDEEVARLIKQMSYKVMAYLKRKGYLDKDGDIVSNPEADNIYKDYESINQATASSLAGRIAFGPNAGKYVTRIGSGFGYGEEIPLAKGKRCYSINGFSLHANTHINTHNRQELEKLIRYISRGPLSNKRLEITKDETVKLQLKTPWANGTSHLLFTAEEFIEKLCALIPPPKTHLVRWSGVFAPNSPLRAEVRLNPKEKKGFDFDEDGIKKYKNMRWAKMLARVFKLDVLKCTKCGGELKPVCSVMSPESVKRYLDYVGINSDPPQRAPPQYVQQELEFNQSHQYNDPEIQL